MIRLRDSCDPEPKKIPVKFEKGFTISICDGFVEYMYKIEPRNTNYSIDSLYQSFCHSVGSKIFSGKMRTSSKEIEELKKLG